MTEQELWQVRSEKLESRAKEWVRTFDMNPFIPHSLLSLSLPLSHPLSLSRSSLLLSSTFSALSVLSLLLLSLSALLSSSPLSLSSPALSPPRSLSLPLISPPALLSPFSLLSLSLSLQCDRFMPWATWLSVVAWQDVTISKSLNYAFFGIIEWILPHNSLWSFHLMIIMMDANTELGLTQSWNYFQGEANIKTSHDILTTNMVSVDWGSVFFFGMCNDITWWQKYICTHNFPCQMTFHSL